MTIGVTLPTSSLALITTLVATPVLIARSSSTRELSEELRSLSTPRGAPVTPLGWTTIAVSFSVVVVLIDLRLGRVPSSLVQLLTILALALAAGFLATLPERERPRVESRLAVWLLAGSILWQAGVRIQLTGRPSVDLALTALWTAVVVTALQLDRRINATMLLFSTTAGASLMVLAVAFEQTLIAPFAGVVSGFAAGLLLVVLRSGQDTAPIGAGAALSVLLAALGILSMSRTDLSPARPAVMAFAVATALLPIVATAWSTVLDRLRHGPGAFASRQDDVIMRLRALGVGTTAATAGIAVVGVIHGAAALASPFLSTRSAFAILVVLVLADTVTLRWLLQHGPIATDAEAGERVVKRLRRVLPVDWERLDQSLLRPGRWVRRSALVWARRGATLPPHLRRTRVTRRPVGLGRLADLRAALVSLSTRRRARVRPDADRPLPGNANIVVASREHDRLLYLDTAAGTVLHRAEHVLVDEERLRLRADVFRYLKGPAARRSDDGHSLVEELVEGQHFVDVPDEARLLALSSLLLDVTALVLETSRPASPTFIARKLRGPALTHPGATHRTVLAPSTTSLDNVVVTPHHEVAWIEAFPLAETSFHMPWFGIAVRVADISPVVKDALERGVLDRALARLLTLGGVTNDTLRRPLDVMRELPWGPVRPEADQPSGR
jgi:hypothetical protein